MRLLLPVAIVAALALIGSCASNAARAPRGVVAYPADYREWTHVRSMVIEEGHPLFDSFGGIHHIYANRGALEGLRRGDGHYGDGAVFAFDLLSVDKAGGGLTEGARKVLGVMQRDASAFASTGGWGFAGFPGASRQNAIANPAQACFDCHAGRADKGYVFSTWRE